MPKDKALSALAAFAEAIQKPEIRRAFENNELTLAKLLKDEGASVNDLPKRLRSFLDDLSPEEMRVLAHLQTELLAAGLAE
jgi:hypothetical protein